MAIAVRALAIIIRSFWGQLHVKKSQVHPTWTHLELIICGIVAEEKIFVRVRHNYERSNFQPKIAILDPGAKDEAAYLAYRNPRVRFIIILTITIFLLLQIMRLYTGQSSFLAWL
jgi:hypothetical protein